MALIRPKICSASSAAIAAAAILGAVLGPAMAEPKLPPDAAPMLAGVYVVVRDGAPTATCTLRLTVKALGRAETRRVRTVVVTPGCRTEAPALARATGWAWTGGGSVSLYAGRPLKEIAYFSPVQDGTGVYLRGAAGRDPVLIELHPQDQ